MLKPELLVGVKLVEAETLELLPLDGMDTGAVACGKRSGINFTLPPSKDMHVLLNW